MGFMLRRVQIHASEWGRVRVSRLYIKRETFPSSIYSWSQVRDEYVVITGHFDYSIPYPNFFHRRAKSFPFIWPNFCTRFICCWFPSSQLHAGRHTEHEKSGLDIIVDKGLECQHQSRLSHPLVLSSLIHFSRERKMKWKRQHHISKKVVLGQRLTH